jgi:DNA-binding NtrC family response regulator
MKKSILVVDDDPLTAQVLENGFDSRHFRIVSVSEAREALNIIRSESKVHVAVLSFSILGSITGSDVVKECMKARIPALLLSGDPESFAFLSTLHDAGFIPYKVIMKPVSADVLVDTIEKDLLSAVVS